MLLHLRILFVAAVGLLVVTQVALAQTSVNSIFKGKALPLTLKDGKAELPSELNAEDAKALGRFHHKVYTVTLEMGKTYRIDHRGSEKFDPYLVIEDKDGNQLDIGTPEEGTAQILFKVAKAGEYRIVAATFQAGQMGKFTLDIGAPTPAQAKEAEFRFRIQQFANISGAQRRNVVDEVRKRLQDKDGDLTNGDFRIVNQLGLEAEHEDPDLAREVYRDAIKQFSAAKNSKLSATTTKQLEATLKKAEVLGKPLEITGMRTDGKEFDLKNLKGKVVLVDFWATWCGPCIAELPNMERAYAKFHGKGFDIIGISLDRPGSEEKLTKFMEARKMPWACINIEDSRKLANRYEVRAIPAPLLVDQTGKVVSFRARGPQLDKLLVKLLGSK